MSTVQSATDAAGRIGGHFAAWEEPELFSDEVRGRVQVTTNERRYS
jgi:hypothetical protein